MSWDQGAVVLANPIEEGVRLDASKIPLRWMASEAEGTFDGSVELVVRKDATLNVAVEAKGTDLLCALGPLNYGGSVTLDWKAKGVSSLHMSSLLLSTERLRLGLENGSVSNFVKNGKFLATFHGGLGGKWEGSADSEKGLQIVTTGMALARDGLQVSGSALFGQMTAKLQQSDERMPWIISFDGMGPTEVAALQKVAVLFEPKVAAIDWLAGVARGSIQYETRWQEPRLEVQDLHLRASGGESLCRLLTFQERTCKVEDLTLQTGLPVAFRGKAVLHVDQNNGVLEGKLGGDNVHVTYDQSKIVGSMGDFLFDGRLDLFGLSIPHFEGDVPSWLGECLFMREFTLPVGRVTSIENGLQIPMQGEWSFACKTSKAGFYYAPFATRVTEGNCEIYAGPSGVDVVAIKAMAEMRLKEKLVKIPLSAPRIQWTGVELAFDIRGVEQEWDFVRIVGKMVDGNIDIDSSKSFLFGSRLEAQGPLHECHLRAEIPCHFLSRFLRKRGLDLTHGADIGGTLKVSVMSGSPIFISVEAVGGEWAGVPLGPGSANCQLQRGSEGWQIQKGRVEWQNKLSFDFEAKVADLSHVDGVLDHLFIDFAPLGFATLQGTVEGKGGFALHSTFEADLDVQVKDVSFDGCTIENNEPLYCWLNSSGMAVFKGIDSTLARQGVQAQFATDSLEIDWKAKGIKAKKIRAVCPTNFLPFAVFEADREIVACGDAELRIDGADLECALQEGFVPVFGAVRHIKDGRLSLHGNSFQGSGKWLHQGKEAHIAAKFSSEGRGKLEVQEPGKALGLVIDGAYRDECLTLQAIEGEFAGIGASFRAIDETHMLGSAKIHFTELSEWIPAAVAEAFHDLEMGGGYEVKGQLTVAGADSSFKGLFCGKEIDFFGFQFKTLMSSADLTFNHIYLHDLLISDAAGSLIVPEIIMEGKVSPWTISIPELTVQDLRPSLLSKFGEEKKALTPLLVRELKIHDFHGLLDDGKTYKAQGELSFINSFKRGKSVFDLPTHLFGRIVGLDLELLIPVEGQLLFNLDQGYFVLSELKDSFSEGRRSQFFLAEKDVPPRMSLRGSLEIFVKMKQFVLFAPTEGFIISIDGKLSDPQFRLQKKKSFL